MPLANFKMTVADSLALKHFVLPCGSGHALRYFDYRCNRFFQSSSSGLFVPAKVILEEMMSGESLASTGLSKEHVELRRALFGRNEFDVPMKSTVSLLLDELTHPFTAFQIASVIIWCLEDYYIYAAVIMILSIVSIVVSILEVVENRKSVNDMANVNGRAIVIRDSTRIEVAFPELVPGDILYLTSGLQAIPADAMLLSGNVLVDESLLTGESVPVSKIAASLFQQKEECHSADTEISTKNIIYSGTKVLRIDGGHDKLPMAKVTSTSFFSLKGSLLLSIMFPRPNQFRFYQDSLRFLLVMTILAALGFVGTLINLTVLKVGIFYIVTRALDLITVVVPPALPATLSVATAISLKRLQRKKVICVAPPKINVASKIDVFCFDKTGTLTEEGLQLYSVAFQGDSSGWTEITCSNDSLSLDSLPPSVIMVMTSCHTLKIINGMVRGDPLDVRMFHHTGWILEENLIQGGEGVMSAIVRPPTSTTFHISHLFGPDRAKFIDEEIGILRSFDFCHVSRRMTTIAKVLKTNESFILSKGAPESIISVCDPATVPSDIAMRIELYSRSGLRVLAFAARSISNAKWVDMQKWDRFSVESQLSFLGLLIFENRLKDVSPNVIGALNRSGIRSIMATGDNPFTSESVGRSCGIIKGPSVFQSEMVDDKVYWRCYSKADSKLATSRDLLELQSSLQLVCCGHVLEHILEFGDAESRILVLRYGSVFARLSPVGKRLLVEALQDDGKIVGFCGDGANDMEALKSADVGISLSQMEASLAAPFIVTHGHLGSVLDIIREGRASLTTSFICFKFMALYSMIQFSTLSLLYSFGSSLADSQFVYIDLVLIVPASLLLSRFKPAKNLANRNPQGELLSRSVLCSIFFQVTLQFASQLGIFLLIKKFGEGTATRFLPSGANSGLFILSTNLYVFTALIFSYGFPHRASFYWPFYAFCGVALIFNCLLVFGWPVPLLGLFSLQALPNFEKLCIILISAGHAIIGAVFEHLICIRL